MNLLANPCINKGVKLMGRQSGCVFFSTCLVPTTWFQSLSLPPQSPDPAPGPPRAVHLRTLSLPARGLGQKPCPAPWAFAKLQPGPTKLCGAWYRDLCEELASSCSLPVQGRKAPVSSLADTPVLHFPSFASV